MRKIDRAIERSSLGTKAAKSARRTVPRASAARIVAASTSVTSSTGRTSVRRVGGKR
jgi:hypothetical protein